MGTLEKILEEIEAKKKGCLDVIKTEVDAYGNNNTQRTVQRDEEGRKCHPKISE